MQRNVQTRRCCVGRSGRMLIDLFCPSGFQLSQGCRAGVCNYRDGGDVLLQQGSAACAGVFTPNPAITQLNQRGTCNSVINDYILVKAGCTTEDTAARSWPPCWSWAVSTVTQRRNSAHAKHRHTCLGGRENISECNSRAPGTHPLAAHRWEQSSWSAVSVSSETSEAPGSVPITAGPA